MQETARKNDELGKLRSAVVRTPAKCTNLILREQSETINEKEEQICTPESSISDHQAPKHKVGPVSRIFQIFWNWYGGVVHRGNEAVLVVSLAQL
jgi:hypothetical protein